MSLNQVATIGIGIAALLAIGWAWAWASEAYHRRGVAKHRAAHPELFTPEYEASPYHTRPHQKGQT